MIKRSIANKVRFEKIKYGEDRLYMQNILMKSENVLLIDYQGYYYIRWDVSATMRVKLNNLNRVIENHSVLRNLRLICKETLNKDLINLAERRANISENGEVLDHVFTYTNGFFMTSYEAIKRFLLLDGIDSAICDKLFKREIAVKHRYPLGLICEDISYI